MKIGIVTMYHKNMNYGGNLQAFALLQTCKILGYDAELISFDSRSKIKCSLSNAKSKVMMAKNKLLNLNKRDYYCCINSREEAISAFHTALPHSKLYFPETIWKANAEYGCFIVGSDQVWNPCWLNDIYSLNFAEKDKYCISYAASLGVADLSEKQEETFSQILKRLDAISVREEGSVELLGKLTDKVIQLVLDPTLLLDRRQWENICAERQIQEKYIFCFLFGNQVKPRKIAAEYAQRHGCTIVTIPFLSNSFRTIDCTFGDIRISSVSPEQFLSLIKYAEFVFTDSFHATVFSHLFEKQFIAYAENVNKTRVRMMSLTRLFETESRFIGDELFTDIDYVDSLPNIPYENGFSYYSEMKDFSIDYLISNLRQAEKNERNN